MGLLTFYWHPMSPPAKVVWSVLESLKIPYEKKYIDLLETQENRTPEYLAINPEGKVPYIVDDGFGIGESRAIICYLCSKYENKNKENQLYPRNIEEKAKVDEALNQNFQHFSDILEYFNIHGVFHCGETGPIETKWNTLENSYKDMERRLESQKYLAGDNVTVADYAGLCVVSGIEDLLPKINDENYPRIHEWKKEMESLPFYEICYQASSKAYCEMYKQMVAANSKK